MVVEYVAQTQIEKPEKVLNEIDQMNSTKKTPPYRQYLPMN